MKTVLVTLGVLATVLFWTESKAADAFEQNRNLGRGVNIIGYDPLWNSMSQARFHAKHFRLLHEAGFTSIRVNLHPFRHMERDRDWALKASWFNTLDWAVTNATAQGLRVILDFHEFSAMGENPEANKEKFLAFWRQLSAHCQAAPANILLRF